MKIISKQNCQDMKKFVEQISKHSEVFTWSKWIWFKLCCRQAHQNIDGNSHIGRYSKGQINIGR